MNTLIFLCFMLFLTSINSIKKHNYLKSMLECTNPVSIINRGYNLPLYFYNIQRDNFGVAKYADVGLDLQNNKFDQFCILSDNRILHKNTGLYLGIRGAGYICWGALHVCEWSCQIQGWYNQSATWYWKDISLQRGAFHKLNALNGSLTAFERGYINLANITLNKENIFQEWIFHA